MALAYLALGTWLNTLLAIAAEAFHLPGWIALLPSLFIGFPLALAFGLWLGRLGLWDILSLKRVRPGIWIPLLITHLGFLILIQALAHGMEWSLDHWLPEPLRQSLLKEVDPLAQAPIPILALVFAAAAIPEEILFRGLILRGFLGRHRPMVAIWLSTALFTVAHGNPLQFPVALMIGACASWYYQATGSLWPGLVAHGLHNLVITLFIAPEALVSGSLIVNPLPSLPWLFLAPFLAILGLLWLRWRFRQPEPFHTGILRPEEPANLPLL